MTGMLPVLLISHGFQPSYEKAFANGLARNGLEVAVVTSDRSLAAEFDPGVEAIPLRGSQDPRRSGLQKARRLIAYTFNLYRMLVVRRIRALHVMGVFITASVPLGWLEMLGYRLLSRRLLLTVHNLLPHDRHTRLNRLILQRIYRMPDTLVVHTKKMREALIGEWGIPASRIVQMEHGVDDLPAKVEPWQPDAQGRLRLLMFGSISRYKGIDIALEALRGFTDFPVSLVIAGECRDASLADELNQLIERVPAEHSVEWRRGFIPEPEVQAFFERADAVLLPYRHIDQSGVLLTAYRFGIPVLAFNVGSFADYVNDETGLVVTERTPAGLQTGFRQLKARMPQLQRERVRALARCYLWEETVRVLLPHY
jgi:glycosyltransferase involved in cell wall biosynthesis